MRKLTYKEVKEYIEGSEGNGCKLLSTEYIDNKTPLLIRCKCGEIFNKSFDKFKNKKQTRCKKCGYNKISESKMGHEVSEETRKKISIAQTGKKASEEAKKKMSIAQKGEKHPNFGKKFSEELRKKISESRKGKRCGENNPRWNPNLTEEERERDRNIQGYQDFINGVYKRDDYTCQICGGRGCSLNAHHLNGYNWYKEGRTNINNGITLCDNKCHNEFHSIYGYGDNTKEQFIEFLTNKYKETQDQYFIDLIEKINNRLS